MQYYFPCKPNALSPDSPLLDELDRSAEWVAEVKKNGWRALPTKSEGGKFELWTRHDTLITEPAELAREALSGMMPDGTILDGEFIHYRTATVKGRMYLFDIIMLEGKLLTDLPFRERRRILESIVKETPMVELAKQVRVGKKSLYFQSVVGDENEGIVLKKLDARYFISTTKCLQNPYWLKVKKVENHIKVEGEAS